MAFEVLLSEEATADLFATWLYIAHQSGAARADAMDSRLRAACLKLADFPHRGTSRHDLEPGLRSIAVARRATIYYRVATGGVEIVRILYAGRDAGRVFERD